MTEFRKKKTMLIFGISSFVGSNLAEYLKNDYRVVGTYFGNSVSIPGVMTIRCDVLNRNAVQTTMLTFKPDVTIYCVGLTSIYDCSEHEKTADALNTVGLFIVAGLTERIKSKLIYLSTSYIFSGLKKNYQENDTPDPNSVFGKTKASAEFFIQKSSMDYIIFRICTLYGRSINPRQMTFFEMLQKKLLRGESVACDTNIHVGFLDVIFLALMIKVSLEQNVVNRLFQLSSTDVMNYYEFAKLYAKVFKTSDSNISKGTWRFPAIDCISSDPMQVGAYYIMDMKNIEFYFNTQMPTVEQSLQATYARFGGKKGAKVNTKQGSGITFI